MTFAGGEGEGQSRHARRGNHRRRRSRGPGSAVPHKPSLPGAETFAGTILHSADYRNPEPYRGKRVLVVGAGNTGAEIALDLCEHGAASVDLCARGPVHVVRRDLMGLSAQVLAILTSWIPVPLLDVLFGALVRLTVGDLSRFGINKPSEGIVARVNRVGKIPLIDIGTIGLIETGRIRVRPDMRRLTPEGVTFADGSGPYDAIVLATGYRPRLDAFIVGAERVLDERGVPRSYGREAELPGLYFVGFKNAVTGLLREIGREAERVAGAISRRAAL